VGVDETNKQLTIIEGIEMREEKIDFLQKQITEYLILTAKENLTEQQTREVFTLISVVRTMEAIGDIIHHNMFPLIAKKRSKKIDFSTEGKQEILLYHSKIYHQIERLEEMFREKKISRGEKILRKELEYTDLDAGFRRRHLERVWAEQEESKATHEMHLEIMDYLKQIHQYVVDIASSLVQISHEISGKKD
jgi:phosphate:Na+ symporter